MKKRLLMAMVAAMMISAAGCSMDADSLTAENAGEKAKEVLDTTKTEFEDVLDVKVPTVKPEDMEDVKDVIDTGKDVVSDIASKAGVAAEGLKDTEIKLPEDASETLRIVRIGDYDVCACIGSHVKSTAEIVSFHINSTSWNDGIFRIVFKVGAQS